MPDAHTNFAKSLVATAPSPASSGTSLVVTAGDGALFPAPPFNAVVFPPGAPQPLRGNAEIVRVTGVSTDTFTIVRNTSTDNNNQAQSIAVGWIIDASITAKTLQDVETQPGVILATQQYAPSSLASYTVAATTVAALDTTNLTLAFTVPANGIVDVIVQTSIVTIGAAQVNLELFDHTSGAVIGYTVLAADGTASLTMIFTAIQIFHLTGLTPGALQVDLAAGRDGGTSATIHAHNGTSKTMASLDYGPTVIQAIASI
jgi:hypothetical protein